MRLELGIKSYGTLCKRELVLQLIQLTDELQSTTAEKNNLLAEKSKVDLENKTELERHQGTMASLTEERDRLREENKQLKTELEEVNEKVRTQKVIDFFINHLKGAFEKNRKREFKREGGFVKYFFGNTRVGPCWSEDHAC